MRRQSGFADVAGERIYWEDAGQGEPALVLCHGASGNHVSWFQQLPELGKTRRVIAWDQRGFGRSTARSGATHPERAALDLGAVLDAIGIPAPVDVAGQSMGGWAALRFALSCPDRVRRLVLADSPGGIVTAELIEALRELNANPLRQTDQLGRHSAVADDFVRRDPERAYLYSLLGGFGEPDLEQILPGLSRNLPSDAELAALRCPVLFVVGARDRIFSPAVIRASAAKLPAAQVAEIPDAGHSPYFEQPRLWNRVVSEFLA